MSKVGNEECKLDLRREDAQSIYHFENTDGRSASETETSGTRVPGRAAPKRAILAYAVGAALQKR